MNPVDRAIAAMILTIAHRPAESAVREDRFAASAPAGRQPTTVARRGQRASRPILPLFAIAALNAGLLGGFFWTTASAANPLSCASDHALATSGWSRQCPCVS